MASEFTFDPVDMVFHVLRESGSLFQALYHDNASRNQDAFPLVYFWEYKFRLTFSGPDERVSAMRRCTVTG
jgi:hypothetical protein